jgi:hypothetical protein
MVALLLLLRRDIISANIASRGKSFKLTPTAQHRESLQQRAVFVPCFSGKISGKF